MSVHYTTPFICLDLYAWQGTNSLNTFYRPSYKELPPHITPPISQPNATFRKKDHIETTEEKRII